MVFIKLKWPSLRNIPYFFFYKKRLLPRNEIIRISKKVGLFQKRSRYYFSKKSRQNEFKSHFRFRHQQQWLLCLETLVVFSSLSPLLCTNVKKIYRKNKRKDIQYLPLTFNATNLPIGSLTPLSASQMNLPSSSSAVFEI